MNERFPTVRELKEFLANFVDEATVHAYEGETTGLVVETPDKYATHSGSVVVLELGFFPTGHQVRSNVTVEISPVASCPDKWAEEAKKES